MKTSEMFTVRRGCCDACEPGRSEPCRSPESRAFRRARPRPPPARPVPSVTRDPGSRRRCPSVTTTSPGVRPFSTTISWSTRCAVMTGRCSTVESGLTTNTNWPSCPVWTACDGTTTAFGSVVSRRETRANWPGQSRRSLLSKIAFSLIVSVVEVDGVVDEAEGAVLGLRVVVLRRGGHGKLVVQSCAASSWRGGRPARRTSRKSDRRAQS